VWPARGSGWRTLAALAEAQRTIKAPKAKTERSPRNRPRAGEGSDDRISPRVIFVVIGPSPASAFPNDESAALAGVAITICESGSLKVRGKALNYRSNAYPGKPGV
jgi:hypothetical protein